MIAAAAVFSYEVVNVSDIDPYSSREGDFLSVDLPRLERQALEAYLSGDYEEAAGYYLAALRYDVSDTGNIYNLACCYGLLGEAELAARYLALAVEAGFSNLGHIERDPDLNPVRQHPAFMAAIDTLTRDILARRRELGTPLYMESRTLLPCRVHVPADYDSSARLPLLVALHGYGSNPDDFSGLWREFDDPDFIFACPRAPFEMEGVDFRGYSWMIGEPGTETCDRAAPIAEEYVLEVVSSLRERYSVSGVYLMGHSQGGGFTYEIGLHNPDVFDGLVVNAGWLDREYTSDEVLEAASRLPVLIIHGREDRSVEFEAGMEAKRLLESFDYDVTLFDFRGGHRVPAEGLRRLQHWMAEAEARP